MEGESFFRHGKNWTSDMSIWVISILKYHICLLVKNKKNLLQMVMVQIWYLINYHIFVKKKDISIIINFAKKLLRNRDGNG
jgi:hypothetical protein